ncbi:MAG TPA: cobalamin-dependent protein, partial [Thermoanaerobaculia bacterium]|nr:cobalamin-dependent protein [Thermoanaerobaculia bacterium]
MREAAPGGGDGRPTVVLYNPRAVFFTMPLALVAIGSHLDPARYRVVIVDGRLEADPEAAVAAAVGGGDAVCLAVTVLTGAPIRDAVAVSRAAKRRRPDLPVVWGGWHPSMFALECLDEPAVDVTVQGQGEETFAEVVERLVAGDALDGCAGCSFRAADGTPRQNPPRPFAAVDGFRRHDFGLLDVEAFFRLKGRRQLDYVSSQGCPFRCAFCADPFVYRRKWSGLPPERIGEEVEDLWRRHRFADLSFQDETFFTYAPRVEAVGGG